MCTKAMMDMSCAICSSIELDATANHAILLDLTAADMVLLSGPFWKGSM